MEDRYLREITLPLVLIGTGILYGGHKISKEKPYLRNTVKVIGRLTLALGLTYLAATTQLELSK